MKEHPEAVPVDLQIFDLFHGYIAKISKDPAINLATMLSLQVIPAVFLLRVLCNVFSGCAPQLFSVPGRRTRGPGNSIYNHKPLHAATTSPLTYKNLNLQP